MSRGGLGTPQHDGVAFDIDAAAAGATGELGVLAGREAHRAVGGGFDEAFEDDGARRHVHPHGEGLGGEHDPHETAGEQLLDGVTEGRDQAGVVRGETAFESFEPLCVTDGVEIGRRQGGGVPVGDRTDLGDVGRFGETDRRFEAFGDGVVAAVAAEPEPDGRQQLFGLEPGDDLGQVGTGRSRVSRAQRRRRRPRPVAGPGRGLDELTVGDVPLEGLVDGAGRGQQVEQPPTGEHVLGERDGPGFLDDDRESPRTPRSQPPNSSALLTVADRLVSRTSSGSERIASSHTAPRSRSAR